MSKHFEILKKHLSNFSPLSDNDIAESRPLWKSRKVRKGDFLNIQNLVCKDLGMVIKGIFRVYLFDPDISVEKNLFFFSENQFLVSFRSHLNQKICHYFIQAMEDSEIIYISYDDLKGLYERRPNWAIFGRLLAERFFTYSQSRTEELLFNTHEKRFMHLLNEHPDIINRIPAYHISSYLGITNPSLSRIRRRISQKHRKTA